MGKSCESCGKSISDYDFIRYGSLDGGYKDICTHCYNTDVATRFGLNGFENTDLDPIEMTDYEGKIHKLFFRTRLLGDIVSIEAFELENENHSSYNFQIIGDPKEELFLILGRLIQKIRRALGVRYIEDGEHGLQISDTSIQGRIGWDTKEEGRIPLLNIDGRDISWEQLGKMMMVFEGWQFRLEIVDRSDEFNPSPAKTQP